MRTRSQDGFLGQEVCKRRPPVLTHELAYAFFQANPYLGPTPAGEPNAELSCHMDRSCPVPMLIMSAIGATVMSQLDRLLNTDGVQGIDVQ